MDAAVDPRLSAYQFCKEHAAVDNAYSEPTTWQWFNAAWDLCANHIGLIYPPMQIREDVQIDPRTGAIRLSYEPSSAVNFFADGRLVASLPPNSPCFGPDRYALQCPSLCCYGCARAVYTVGEDFGCNNIPAWFVQAVAQVFAFLAENRGDVQREPQLLARCGALSFLSVRTLYVL
jgi:hypothetical protein